MAAKKSKRTRKAERNLQKQLALVSEADASVLAWLLHETEDPILMGLARSLKDLREAERLDREDVEAQQEMFRVEDCKGGLPNPFMKRML